MKRKRSSLVGAFVSTHGRSIEDVDKSIMEAKSAMMELTQVSRIIIWCADSNLLDYLVGFGRTESEVASD